MTQINMNLTRVNELSNAQLIDACPAVAATSGYSKASEKYSFVSTLQATNFLREMGWKPVWIDQVKSKTDLTRGYNKHCLRFTREDLVLKGHRMDLVMFNAHDCGSSYELLGGVFNFICANRMVSGDELAHFRHRHINFDAEKFIESATNISGYLERTADVLDDWRTINMTHDEKMVYAASAHELMYGAGENEDEWRKSLSDAPIRPVQLLKTRRREDEGNDLWTTFNKVQENATQGGLRGRNSKGGRMETREIKSLDKDKKLNMALWTLTEKMAELKAA